VSFLAETAWGAVAVALRLPCWESLPLFFVFCIFSAGVGAGLFRFVFFLPLFLYSTSVAKYFSSHLAFF